MKITKAMEKAFAEKARELVARRNPYIEKAIEYFKGKVVMYLYANQSMTKEEIDDAYFKTALKDIKAGFSERMVGYYDKWYRYSRTDEGAAYDAGTAFAVRQASCPIDYTIIEIAACNR